MKPIIKPIAPEPDEQLNVQDMRRQAVLALEKTLRDNLNKALLDRLADILKQNKGKLSKEVFEGLSQWAQQDANLEALADWLGKGGWDKVEKDLLEARLFTAGQTLQGMMGAADNVKRTAHSISVIWEKQDVAAILLYDTPRTQRGNFVAGTDKDGKIKLVEGQQTKVETEDGLHFIGPVERFFEPDHMPKKINLYCGADAMRIGMQHHNWLGIDGCLTSAGGTEADWLRALAGFWLRDKQDATEARLKTFSRALSLTVRPVAHTAGGDDWTRLPRALDGAAAMGGAFSVNVDGETYAEEPAIAGAAVGQAIRPKALDIVPAEWLGGQAQLTLALDLDNPPPALKEFLIETATKTAHLARLPNMCPKLLGFMFAVAPPTGRPVKGTLQELTQWLYPDWKERKQHRRDRETVGAAFVATKGLRLVERKIDGVMHPYDLFIMDYDLSNRPEAEIGLMMNPWLADRMQGGHGGGFALLNMSRWLGLDIANPRLFPLALRLAALWDEARNNGIYCPERLHEIEADKLAWQCNTLPEGAAMYRARKTDSATARAALAAARASLEADLNKLQNAGLLGKWKQKKIYGKGFTVLPVPPNGYDEACKRAVQKVIQNKKYREGKAHKAGKK